MISLIFIARLRRDKPRFAGRIYNGAGAIAFRPEHDAVSRNRLTVESCSEPRVEPD
jgi:hypothetical protein